MPGLGLQDRLAPGPRSGATGSSRPRPTPS